MFFFSFGQRSNIKPINRPECKLNLRIVRDIESTVKMSLDAVDIDIVKMNIGKTTNVLCINSIPTGTIVLPIVYISEDTERTLGFCNIVELFEDVFRGILVHE